MCFCKGAVYEPLQSKVLKFALHAMQQFNAALCGVKPSLGHYSKSFLTK